MSLTAIKEKVAKLLALSNSSNENEAAMALAKAQKIILTYKLSIAECLAAGNTFTDEQIVRDGVPLIAATKIAQWQKSITYVLAKHNDCKTLLYPSIGVVIFGRESDIQNVRQMLNYSIAQLWNLSPKGKGRIYSDSWYLGAINTISRRLEDMRREELKAVTTYGLVKLNEQSAKVETYISENIKTKSATKSSATIDARGYYQGVSDGKKINLHNGNTLS